MSDPWITLRQYTQARIALGRVGCATPTKAHLDFQLAHALARDAVHQPWPVEEFATALNTRGWACRILASAVAHREQYLQRPDLGRRLSAASEDLLQTSPACDIAIIVSNGLSSSAVQQHGLALLDAVIPAYRQASLNPGPICLVPHARVALSDQIGASLNARLAVMIVGERPGLSAADSLGIYMTYAPTPGNSDAERNCISNIRPPQGLDYAAAAQKLLYLSQQALHLGLSGVALKDDMPILNGAEPGSELQCT
jgi:ethanolamine ammonia-lyase small subunit